MDETNLYQTNQTENVNEGEDVSVEPGILDEIEGFFSKMIKSFEESIQKEDVEEEPPRRYL